MKYKLANYFNSRKGQIKIQEMAFVIVALVIFFAIVSLIVVTIYFSGIKSGAQDVKDESARELVRTLASSPEFSWGACSSCIDKDKLFLIKRYVSNYSDFWGVDYLAIDTVYPQRTGECLGNNYPNCKTITLINKTTYIGVPSEAYISLCMQDGTGKTQCDLGKIYASIRRTA